VKMRLPTAVQHLFQNLPPPYDSLEYPQEFLTDENNWVPSRVVVKLFENAKVILNDPDAAFKIGVEAIRNRQFGYIQRFFITTFGNVSNIIKSINHINAKFTSTKTVTIVHDVPEHIIMRLHWNDEAVLSKDICEYNKGVFCAVPTLWKLEQGAIEEPLCHFKGDPYCEYDCTWKEKKVGFHFFNNRRVHKGALLDALKEIENDKNLLKSKYDEVYKLNLELQDKIVKLEAINKASRVMVSYEGMDKFLEMTMEILVNVLKFDRALLMLLDPKSEELCYGYSTGGDPSLVKRFKHYRVKLNRRHNLMVKVATSGEPVLIKDAAAAGLNPENAIISTFKPFSFCVVPLKADKNIVGVLGADRTTYREPITEKDLEYLSVFANNIAVSLVRAQLDDELKDSYLNSVKALAQALEEKDPYTRGHSERVSNWSAELAEEMKLHTEEVEFLKTGAMLHDIGKIGVPESIIRSPKPMTDEQFNIMKIHPIRGVEILAPISYLKNHLHLIRNHHECYDGSGYPDGLKGDEIPLGAQIITVADAYDAMTSSRPYRKAFRPKHALKEILANAGSQFGPAVCDAFEKIFEKISGQNGKKSAPHLQAAHLS
jgi:putative nucleotidyltransferase with HDIG domain